MEFRGLIGGINIIAPVSVIIGDGQAVSITAPVQIEADELHPDRLAAAFKMDYQALQQQRWTPEADAYLSRN